MKPFSIEEFKDEDGELSAVFPLVLWERLKSRFDYNGTEYVDNERIRVWWSK